MNLNKKASTMNLTTERINSYDYIIIAFSGRKDSQAMFLDLLDRGVDKNKVELWRHIIDGREGSTLMDWKCTEDYCRKFAEAFNVPIYFSWKEGEFKREMLRNNTPTAPNHFEYPSDNNEDNIIECGLAGGKVPNGIRNKFPQVSADLRVRWCSAYLKIDVCTAAINNQSRFIGKKTLVLTGERAQESSARAKYKMFEPDKSDRRDGKRVQRHVDHWKSVHDWSEERVWEIIGRYKVLAHPAYRLGWARLSCIACIFGSKNQFASLNVLDKEQAEKAIQVMEETIAKVAAENTDSNKKPVIKPRNVDTIKPQSPIKRLEALKVELVKAGIKNEKVDLLNKLISRLNAKVNVNELMELFIK